MQGALAIDPSNLRDGKGYELDTATNILNLRHTGWYADPDQYETLTAKVYAAATWWRDDIALSQAGEELLRSQGFLVFHASAINAPVATDDLDRCVGTFGRAMTPTARSATTDEAMEDATG